MKKWIMSSCMGAALALSIGTVAMGQNGNGNGVGEFCKPLTEELGVPNDLCVNCVNQGQDDVAVCICKNAGNVPGFPSEPFLGEANLGQCVKLLHEGGVP